MAARIVARQKQQIRIKINNGSSVAFPVSIDIFKRKVHGGALKASRRRCVYSAAVYDTKKIINNTNLH